MNPRLLLVVLLGASILASCKRSSSSSSGAPGPTTYRVPADYPSIQAAVDAAPSGETIRVAPGVYRESVGITGKRVRLVSDEGAHATTLIGTGSAAIRVTGVDSVRIDGFTVTGRTLGLDVPDASKVAVARCRFTRLAAGAIRAEGAIELTNCILDRNRGSPAPMVLLGGGTILGCTVAGNGTTSASPVADAIAYGSVLRIDGTIIARNGQWFTPALGAVASGASLSVTHCCLEEAQPGVGNFVADPRFADPHTGDFHLRADSPCVDQWPGPRPDATDGEGDPAVGAPDIGADEIAPHLYSLDPPRPGGEMHVRVVGPVGSFVWMAIAGDPSLAPGAAGSYRLRGTPTVVPLGAVPSSGVVEWTTGIPMSATAGLAVTAQALVSDPGGPRFTNAVVLRSAAQRVLSVPLGFATLQQAVDVASDGDRIDVTAGTYRQLVSIVGKTVDVRGVGGRAVLDVTGMPFGVRVSFNPGGFCRLFNIAVENADASAIGVTDAGLHLVDCRVAGSGSGSLLGGGIVARVARLWMDRTEIVQNTAANGGGIYADGGAVRFRDCTIAGNRAVGAFGGIGGGLYLQAGGHISRCVVSANRADSARNPGMGGGALFGATPDRLVVSNSLFTGNTASRSAGIDSRGAVIVNCTIANNNGSGLDLWGTRLENCIVWGNAGAQVERGQPEYCCIEGGHPGIGNIALDPLFDANFRLTAGSPCIDAGSNAASELPFVDIDGDPRIVNGRVDIGADEFTGR